MVARIHARNLLAIVLIAALSAAACGGSATEPATAERADDASEPSSVAEHDAAEAVESSAGETPSAAKKAACDDGTCTLCGDAQCPTGWYCDENAKGGPACGWLPECAKKPTCACVKRVFSGSCEERNGGLYVKE
ncbi:MAG TPA: hypothetical protein VMS65_02945 [Polyangiaceae bacterium]|nr:hypothetical protein [Polyangiaceae bacterium]